MKYDLKERRQRRQEQMSIHLEPPANSDAWAYADTTNEITPHGYASRATKSADISLGGTEDATAKRSIKVYSGGLEDCQGKSAIRMLFASAPRKLPLCAPVVDKMPPQPIYDPCDTSRGTKLKELAPLRHRNKQGSAQIGFLSELAITHSGCLDCGDPTGGLDGKRTSSYCPVCSKRRNDRTKRLEAARK